MRSRLGYNAPNVQIRNVLRYDIGIAPLTVTMIKVISVTASEHVAHSLTALGHVTHTTAASEHVTQTLTVEDSV